MEDVIYLESDAEITEAIDKLKGSSGDQVKIVVPGRSSLLQSVVNLKLLKRSADSAKKELVLVTNDRTAKNLAGSVGLAVATSVKAAPKIPDSHAPEEEKPDIDEAAVVATKNPLEEADTDDSASGKEDKPPSGQATASTDTSSTQDEKKSPMTSRRSVGDSDDKPKGKANKDKGSKKLPDFNALQKRLWLAIGGAIFLAVMVVAWIFLPSATVKLQVNAKKSPVNTKFITDTSLTKSDYANQVLMAQELTTSKSLSANFTATGKKEVGTKASGTISIQNCDDANQHALPAGSIVSTSGKNFTTNSAVTIPGGSTGGGKVNCSSNVSVGITATSAGESYNFGSTSFTLTGFSALFKATGSTSGGTTKQVTVVTQSDIDNAKKGMLDGQETKAKEELVSKASDDSVVIEDAFKAEESNFKSTAAAGSEASNGTVSATVKYSLVEVPKAEIDKMLNQIVKADIEGNNEIYDNGTQNAKYTFVKELSNTQDQIQLATTAFYGEQLDREKIAQSVAGKSKKDVPDIVRQYPGVSGATVEAWPSLLPNMPIMPSHIKVEPQVSTD